MTRKLDGDGTWVVRTNRKLSQGAVEKSEILIKLSPFENNVQGGMRQHEKE